MTRLASRPLPSNTRRTFFAVVAITAIAFFSWAAPNAIGHNVVLGTIPATGSTVTDSPVDIRITTNDQLLDLTGTGSGFAMVVKDAEGLHYGDGCVTIGDTDMSTSADLGQAGDYTVTFQFVSADGHSLSDSFSFIFSPNESHSPARGFPDPPVCGVESGLVDAPVGEATESDTSEGAPVEPTVEEVISDDQTRQGPVTLAIAAVLVVLALALLFWMVSRRGRS